MFANLRSTHLTIKQINIFLFIFLLCINYFQPLIVDDLSLSSSAALYNHTILAHIFSSYLTWSGRVTAQILAYIFFNKPYQDALTVIFNLLNTLLLVSFINIIFKISVKNNVSKFTVNTFLVFIFIFLLILISSGFFKNTLWKTVGIQYFWGIWLLSWLYYQHIFSRIKSSLLSHGVILFLLGVFIGLYNEIYFAILTIIISMYIFKSYIIDKQKINKNLFLFFLGNIIGGVILVAAPGNYVRQQELNLHKYIPWQEKFYLLANAYLEHKLFIFLFSLALVLILINKAQKPYGKFFSIATLLLILFVMLPVANYGLIARVLMLQYVIIIIILFQYLFSLDKVCLLINKVQTIWLVIPNLILLSVLFYAYFSLYNFNIKRYQQIEEYHHKNITSAVFKSYNHKFWNKLVYFDDIESDSYNWKNKFFADYYEFKEVRSQP